MSIANRITEMEQHIGNAYDKIEDLGVDLTDVDKNIDNISSMLENVWEEYPKVSVTDVEEASIDGTKKGRMNIDLKGQTEQEQLSGKNLFDANAINNINITIENNGAKILITNGAGENGITPGVVKNLCPTLKVGDVIKFDFETNAVRGGIAVNCIYLSITGFVYHKGSEIEVTQDVLDSQLFIYAGQTANVYYNNFMFLKSTETDTSWEPFCGGIPAPNPRL